MEFIIFIIIASIIGNVIKGISKQGGASKGPIIHNRPQGQPPLPGYNPGHQGSIQVRNQPIQARPGVKNAGSMSDNPTQHAPGGLNREGVSLEGRRHDIGKSYESIRMPSKTPSRATLEGISLENAEVVQSTYKEGAYVSQVQDGESDEDIFNAPLGKGKGLDFTRDSVINGIIMAEVLAPPKCKRR